MGMVIPDEFIDRHMTRHGRLVDARLVTAMALLEHLRGHPSLQLDDHVADSRTEVKSHQSMAAKALARFGLDRMGKSYTYGRRSNAIGKWGQRLLDLMGELGLASSANQALIESAQAAFASRVQKLLEQKPIEVQIGGRTVQAVIRELLEKAEATGKGGDVAQYLVGAKLELRLEIQLPKHGANLADKRSKRGSAPRPGDHEIEDAVFEVALGPPDEKHLEQTAKALKTPRRDVWLLTRNEHVGKWREGIAERDDIDLERVVVSSIEMFVGQNLAELAGFSSDSKIEVLTELCRVYNEQWIETVGGTPGMRIELTP